MSSPDLYSGPPPDMTGVLFGGARSVPVPGMDSPGRTSTTPVGTGKVVASASLTGSSDVTIFDPTMPGMAQQTALNTEINGAVGLADGSVVVAGEYQFKAFFGRLNAQGTFLWQVQAAINGSVLDLGALDANRVVASVHVTDVNKNRFDVVRLTIDGKTLERFTYDTPVGSYPSTIAGMRDAGFLVGGPTALGVPAMGSTVIRAKPDGTPAWQAQFPANVWVHSAKEMANGEVNVVGRAPGPNGNSGFLATFDGAGAITSQTFLGQMGAVNTVRVTDGMNGPLVLGGYRGDLLVAQLDANRMVQWARGFGDGMGTSDSSMGIMSDGNGGWTVGGFHYANMKAQYQIYSTAGDGSVGGCNGPNGPHIGETILPAMIAATPGNVVVSKPTYVVTPSTPTTVVSMVMAATQMVATADLCQ